MRYVAAILAFIGLLLPAAAMAQATQSFSPTGQTSLSVSNSSSRVAFASAGPTLLVINTGSNPAYLAFGGSAVSATTGGYLLGTGCSVAYSISGQGYVAAITASSTTTLQVTTGSGVPTLQPSGCASTATISGTVSSNLAQVNGQAVQVGVGAAGTGTQRVTTSTDSTIATVTAVTSITNPVTVTDGAGALNVIVDSGTVTTVGTLTTVTNPVGIKGADGSTIASTSNPVPVNNPLGITPTDRTITSATGASQTVMGSNAARHSLIIQNTGNANCGINPTGGTAIIGGAATLTLFSGGSYQPRIPTLSAVTAICTSGQPLYAEEN